MYGLESDPLFLVGTAEVPLASLIGERILDAAELPLRYVGYSTCFRREAGAAGKDTRGIFRVHQFNKLELFSYCLPDTSWDEQEMMLGIEEEIAQELGFHYRVVNIAAGDLGAPAARKFDIEVWLPGQERYRELTSCSNCTDYQARRLGTRFRGEDGKTQYRAHAQRHRDHLQPHPACPDRVWPAGRRVDRHARGAAGVRRPRHHRTKGRAGFSEDPVLSRLQPLAKLGRKPVASPHRHRVCAVQQRAEYGEWIAVLVYAYAHGGASASGLLAFAQLAPCVILAPILSTFADRYQPGKVLVVGYAAQAVGMGTAGRRADRPRAASGRVRVCDPGRARVQRHPSDRKRALARGRSQPRRADRGKRRSGLDRERRSRGRAADRGRR